MILFDLEIHGHHANYISHILQHWPHQQTRLHVVISPRLLKHHSTLRDIKTVCSVEWHPITTDELAWYTHSKRSLVRHALVEWQLLCRYAKKLAVDRVFIPYIDRFQLSLALHLPFPCHVSGIYFRPKFHYHTFVNSTASARPTMAERIHNVRTRCLWWSGLRHRQLKTLLTLDPFAVNPLQKLNSNAHVRHLPDPVDLPSMGNVEHATINRQTLGIDEVRVVLLLFGLLNQRKGIYPLFEALSLLPKRIQNKITVLLVGHVDEEEQEQALAAIQQAQETSFAQIILHDKFIADEDIPHYFAMSDVVLTLYQRHVGSSGVLLLAAAAGKPVLSSSYGLLGEWVRRHELGKVVDSQNPDEIAQALKQLIGDVYDGAGKDIEQSINRAKAAQFVQTHSTEQFVDIISSAILSIE
ncbi:MAG: glycosyltransferase [Chloroflexota bacterium]